MFGNKDIIINDYILLIIKIGKLVLVILLK